MIIAYIGKHNNGGNDEEGAIKHAFESLGHVVNTYTEQQCYKAVVDKPNLVLINHFHGKLPVFDRFECPKISWCFDLIMPPEEGINIQRFETRKDWADTIVDKMDYAFFTDGDYVNQDKTGKAVWLPQAMDQRLEKRQRRSTLPLTRILFTGNANHNQRRQEFVRFLTERFGDRFLHVSRGLHGIGLAKVVAEALLVVCPDSPVTDNYWSNRVYMAAGLGACTIHPLASKLEAQYRQEKEMLYYDNLESLASWIDYCTHNPQYAEEVGNKAYLNTRVHHTYINRAEFILKYIELSKAMKGGI